MASTQITGRQIADGSIERSDINISAAGKALIRKIIETPSTGLTISSYTGADSGTGDVTLAIDTNTIATRAWVQAQGYLTSNDGYISEVALHGNDLQFTGVGNAFSGNVDLSSLIPTEVDTLATVTSRGAVTSTPVTFNSNVTLGNNADLIFQDLAGVFPTTGKGFDWTLNNDGARIYAIQPSSDSIDFVFQLRDNATTNDRFVFWVQEWQGVAYDKYPLIIRGGTEFDLVDSGLFIRGTQVITNGRNLQNVSGNISMFTNDSGYITVAALNGYATQTYVNTNIQSGLDSLAAVAHSGAYADLSGTPAYAITATQWTVNHTLADGTRYLINDVVYDNGNIYKALFENESIPTSNTTYWQLVGPGSRINLDGRDIPNIQFTQLSSVPTTIAGYGITNAYTDAQIQNFFNGANAITGYNKSNWDTAYSWGNHATAGYQPASTAINTSNIGSQSVNYANSAGSSTTTLRGIVEDTRGGQRTPTDYDDYRVSWEFTNQISGLSGNSTWWSAMTIQGWHDGYAAWQIIGPASSAVEDFYLRSGNNDTWNTSRRIWHNGDFTTTNVSNWNTAYSWGNHATVGYATQTWVQSQGYLTSVSDIWVNTSGDTMTGALTFQGGWASTILDGDNVVLRKPNYSSGGWARTLLNFQEYDTTSLFQIGGYGSNNTMTYGYLGSAYNTPTFRWYANKNVVFDGNVGFGVVPSTGDRVEVAGSFRVHTGNNWDGVTIYSDGANGYIRGLGDETGLHIRSEYGNIYLADDRGVVGIGDIHASYKFNVSGAIRLTGSLVFDDTTSNTIQHRAGTDINTLVTVGHGGFDHNGYLRIGGANVATQSWVTSQGYLTSYTETDTLNSVTTRSATTSNTIQVGKLGIGRAAGSNESISVENPEGTWLIQGFRSGVSAGGLHTNDGVLHVQSANVRIQASSNATWNGDTLATRPWVTSQGYLTSLPAHNHDGVYLPINPDGDGPAWSYADENPTINGKYVGGGQRFGADGDNLTGGFLQARHINAYDGHVNATDGYFVGLLEYGANSGIHNTTQVIDSGGRWVGVAIADNKIASSGNWNTAYSWGNHASIGYATQAYVNTAVSNLVDSAPGTLDTLNELAAALGDDPNFATTVTNSIATKLPLAGGTMSGKILTPSSGADAYGGAIEIRERAYVINTQSDWSYSPAISFHWGNRHVQRFGLRADGLFAVDDSPIALRSWVTAQGYLTSYSETDTLASVTNRGESTTGRINVRGIGNQGGGNIMMGNTGEGTVKWSYLTSTHYNASSQPQGFALIGGLATSGGNAVVIGGNIYESNPATEIQFWTHGTNTHNLGGTQRGVINSSGNWGIGVTTPQKKLDVFGSAGIVTSIGSNISPGEFVGLHFGYSESYINNDSYKKSALVFERTDNNNQGGNASGKIHFLLNNYGSSSATSLTHSVVTIDSDANGTVGSVRMGIGTRNPSYPLDVNGTSRFSQLAYFDAAESINLYGVRGRFTNEYIHLYNKVGVGHPGGWGQGEPNTPVYGLSTYGGINIGYGYDGSAVINTYTRINYNWGGGTYGTEAFTIRGTYPSLTLRSTNADNKWLFHTDGSGDLRFYEGSEVDTNSWTNYITFNRSGQIDAIGGNSSQWNTAFGWGNHAGLYIPLSANVNATGWVSFSASTQGTPIIKAIQQDSSSGYYLFQGVTGSSEVFRVERSGNIYMTGNLVATQSWVQSQGYITSVSDVWVNTSGDTMTGSLRFNEGSGFGRVAYLDNYHGMILRGIPSDAAGNVTVGDYTSLIQHSGDFRFYRTNGSINELYFQVNASAAYWRGNTIWHSGNDGAGSGLDADLLDGFQASQSGGGNVVLTTASNGYLYVNNWIHPANGTGLFYDSGPHFYESEGQMYSSHALRVNANILITDGTDNNRFTKGSNFLNLRDPWNNLHMRIDSGGGMYFDAGHFLLRRPDGGTNWLYLDGSNYNVYIEQHNYARVTFRYNTDRYAQSWYNSTTGAYWWVTTDAGQLGLHRNGDGDKFYFSNGGDFYSTTNGWLSTALAGKSNTGHTHDDRYYTESESDARYQPIENQRLSTSNSPTFAGLTINGGVNAYAGVIRLNEIRFTDTAGSTASDPYTMRWVSESSDRGAGLSWLEFQLNDDSNEEIRIYGNSCVGYGCGTYSENLYHRFRADGYAWHAGDLEVGGTITENSSIRYKENVRPLESVSDKIAKVAPVRYNKKGGSTEEIGFIAEDMATIYPEVVKFDAEGRPDGINYTRLSAILIKAVQELTNKVNKLEKKA